MRIDVTTPKGLADAELVLSAIEVIVAALKPAITGETPEATRPKLTVIHGGERAQREASAPSETIHDEPPGGDFSPPNPQRFYRVEVIDSGDNQQFYVWAPNQHTAEDEAAHWTDGEVVITDDCTPKRRLAGMTEAEAMLVDGGSPTTAIHGR